MFAVVRRIEHFDDRDVCIAASFVRVRTTETQAFAHKVCETLNIADEVHGDGNLFEVRDLADPYHRRVFSQRPFALADEIPY